MTIPKPVDQNVANTLSILRDILDSASLHGIALRLWEGTIWKPVPDSATRCTLVLKHPGALRKMLLPPSDLNLGEAYIYNDFDVEGEMESLLPLIEYYFKQHWGKLEQLRYVKRLLSLPNSGQPRPGNVAAKMRGRLHSKDRDRAATNYHYDRSNDFFALWLDSRMIYSCAYFATPNEGLETAQQHKLEYVCRKLRLKPAEHVLDIGCGWGGLAIYAAQHHGVDVDAITLSEQQAEFARNRIKRAGLEHRCHVDIRDYRDVDKPQRYDKLVAIESIAEHAGEALLPSYFQCASKLLRPGGVLLNQAVGVHSIRPVLGADFIHRYIFPDGEAVPISTTLRAAEAAGFEVRDVENLRDHYVHTLRHWLSRLEQNANEVRRLAGEIAYRSVRLYLSMGIYEMGPGAANLYQILLVKPETGRSGLPLKREDWYV